MNQKNLKLAVIGLGYVGLPLAVEFAKSRSVVGYDIDKKRLNELRKGFDRTNEISSKELSQAKGLKYTSNSRDLKERNCYIVTVPTPLNNLNKPDLSALLSASSLVGKVLSSGDIVIYESTVYPGATEEDCCFVLSKNSGLNYATSIQPNNDNIFYLGYSPERINPGDKSHRLKDIVKVTSGSTPEIAELIDNLYASIISAGTYKAESIKIAEAAKVIENTQRDVNIALINDLCKLFNKMNIDTEAVLKAAGTKWNFLPFRPGLVGGHCIGVDPYYLMHKAQEIGYKSKMIGAGRSINDSMGKYVAKRMLKALKEIKKSKSKLKILILGLTFKENCPDLRNSQVINVISVLRNHNCIVDVYDPWVDKNEAFTEYNIMMIDKPNKGNYDGVIIAVKHDLFVSKTFTVKDYLNPNGIIYDLKYVLPKKNSDLRL